MVEIGIGTSTTNVDYDGGNISIKRHAVRRDRIERDKDELAQADRANYREDRIPPADYPQLEQSDPNASNSQPMPPKNTPAGRFARNLNNSFGSLNSSQMASLKANFPNLTQSQAAALLSFAYNHPEADVDPAVRQVLQELIQSANQETREQFDLSSDWQPDGVGPDSQAADREIAEDYNNHFEDAVHRLVSDDDQANAVIFAHYDSEYAGDLKPELQSVLHQAQETAANQTRAENGMPANYEMPTDNSEFTSRLGNEYYLAFNREMSASKHELGLSDDQMQQLRTLHFSPEANVPDREKLLPILYQLNAEALNHVKEEYNLPKDFVLRSSNEGYKQMLAEEFTARFSDAVKHFSPPLTSTQKQLLLSTGGLDGSRLSPELKAIFETIKGEVVAEMQVAFGLPRNWDPKTNKLSKGEGKTTTTGQATTSSTEETDEAWSSVSGARRSIFSRIGRKGSSTERTTINVAVLGEVTPRDGELTRSLFNHVDEFQKNLTTFANTYLSGDDRTLIGDEMLAVSLALSNLRHMIYEVMRDEAKAANTNAVMQKDNQRSQSLIQQHKIEKARKQADKKECSIYKFLNKIPVVGKGMTNNLKCMFWVVDIISGGVLSVICESCGMESLALNPLCVAGIMAKKDAQWFDLALCMVIIALEIVISSILCQPELVMAEVALATAEITNMTIMMILRILMRIAMRIAQKAAEAAIKKAMKEAAEEAAKKGGQMVLKEASIQAAKQSAKQAAEKATEAAIKKCVKEMMQKAVENGLKKSTAEAVEKAVEKGAEKMARKAVKKCFDEVFEKALEKSAQTAVKKGAEEGSEEGVEASAKAAAKAAQKEIDELIKEAVEEIGKESFQQAGKSSLKGAAKASGKVAARKVKDAFRAGERNLSRMRGFVQRGTEEAAEQAGTKGVKGAARQGAKSVEKMTQELIEESGEITTKTANAASRNAAKAKLQNFSRIWNAINLLQDTMNSSFQVAGGIIQMNQHMKQAKQVLRLAELEASLENLAAQLKVIQKIMKDILEVMPHLATWINDINKQQSQYWKKMQIHFIAA